MSPARWRLLSLALSAATAALIVLAIALAAVDQQSWQSVLGGAMLAVPYAIVGGLLTWRLPGNLMGWLLQGTAFFFFVNDAASLYSVLDYNQHGGQWPLGPIAVLVQPSWAPAIVFMGVALLLFPDARLPLGRWRWVLWTFIGVAAVWMVGAFAIALNAIIDDDIHIDPVGNLTQLGEPTGPAAWWGGVQILFFVMFAVTTVSSLAHQISRFRRAHGEERLQLQWLLSGGVVFVVSLLLTVPFSNDSSTFLRLLGSIGNVGLAVLPISIGIAVLRYRLFEIDRIISRTLSYAIVTGLLIGVYVSLILLVTHVLQFRSSVGVAAAALASAALFTPVRRRVQRLVDRRFDRVRYNAAQTVTGFAARLRDEVDLSRIEDELVEAVRTSMQPAHLSMWIPAGVWTAASGHLTRPRVGSWGPGSAG